MIQLTAFVEPGMFDEDASASPETTPPGALMETYFWAPVRFHVDGVELLDVGGSTPPTALVPILGLAHRLRGACTALALAQPRGIFLGGGGGDLTFEPDGPSVTISSKLLRRVARTSIVSLDTAVDTFGRAVARTLSQSVPRLTLHPDWAHWFAAQ